jgi:two-component system chemotaxis response regulator CheB
LSAGRTATQLFRTVGSRSEVPVEQPPDTLVVVAASTGGPTALLEIFTRFPASASAALIVAQHMPERFTKTFAERLDRIGSLEVREAADSQRVSARQGFILPGGQCAEVLRIGSGLSLRVVPPTPEDRYVPSADRLFETAAKAYGERVIAVVLTGMGDDGARGAVAVKRAGGRVFAEAAETAVIYGMPGATVRTGAVERSLPLRALAEHVASLVI